MYRLAHLSDPHLGPVARPRLRDLANKRIVGYMNWRRGRDRTHDMGLLNRLIADMQAQQPNHVACTGDLINIGLRAEFAVARRFLEKLGPPDRVSVVPGNHDAYLRACLADIERFLGCWMTSDSGRFEGFPYVRMMGPIAVIGTSSAVPTSPFVASGMLGREQRRSLSEILTFLGTQPLARVVLIHHPPHRRGATVGRGLTDAGGFEEVIAGAGAELILHGHNHVTSVARITGPKADVPVVGVPSCSAIRGRLARRAAYHLFDIDLTEAGIALSGRTRGLRADGTIGDLGPLPL